MSLAGGGLGSPFNTPKRKRFTQHDFASPSSTPRRTKTPLGPATMLTSSPAPTPGPASASASTSASALAPPQTPFRSVPAPVFARPRTRPVAKFGDLPIELVQLIHLYSLSDALPFVDKRTYDYFKYSGTYYRARWCLAAARRIRRSADLLDHVLTRPVATREVIERIVEIWEEQHGGGRGRRSPPAPDDPEPATPSPLTAPTLRVRYIPRRLVRTPAGEEPRLHPLVPWLVDKFGIDIDADKSYPLKRGALDRNYELVEFLLSRGAKVTTNQHLAIQATIKNKDLRMLKLLVESGPLLDEDEKPVLRANGEPVQRRDRVQLSRAWVDAAIEEGANDIVKWLIQEKDAMPSLKQLMTLGKALR